MKRFFCVLLAICFCVSLTACSDPTPPEINKKNLKILLVCEGEVAQETSQAAIYASELQEVAQSFGIDTQRIMISDGITAANVAFVESVMRSYIKDGYRVVFGVEEGYAEATKKLAAEFPYVTFIQVGEADASLPNFFAYQVKGYEGAYLCGLVAGELSEGGNLGMIAANTNSAQTRQMANAFLLGARVRKPQATLVVTAANISTYRTVVTALEEQDCEGVLVTNDCADTVDFAKNAGMRVYTALGPYDDEMVTFNVAAQHRNQWTDTLQALLFNATPYYNDMRVGYAEGFLQCRRGFEQETDTVYTFLVKAAQTMLIKGTWDVFSGVSLTWDSIVQAFAETPTALKDTSGTIRIAAGAGVPTTETLRGMDWWLEGITVQ